MAGNRVKTPRAPPLMLPDCMEDGAVVGGADFVPANLVLAVHEGRLGSDQLPLFRQAALVIAVS